MVEGENITVNMLTAIEAKAEIDACGSASWRQYPAYAQVAADQAGAESQYLLVSVENQKLAIANIRIKYLPVIPAGIAVIPQGPVMLSDAPNAQALTYAALRKYLVQEKGLTLRVNPPVNIQGQSEDATPMVGFTAVAGSEYQTFVMDLQPGIEALRKGLNGKWRTDLRRGEKGKDTGDISITRSTDPNDFRLFQPLLTELAEKKGFQAPQDANFFADVAEKCEGNERLAVQLAWHGEDLVGGHIGAYSGHMAVYLLGATNDKGRDLRASFLLQWAAIEYALELGLSHYDLGGVDEQENPSVFRFKKRMGGVFYKGPCILEARAAWPKGQIVHLAENLYNRLKG